MPARRDIDPLDVPGLLGHLVLIDCPAPSEDFRFRLVGTRVVDWVGHEFTGRDLAGARLCTSSGELRSALWLVARRRRGIVLRGECASADSPLVRFEVLALPLSGDGVQVDMILAGFFLLDHG